MLSLSEFNSKKAGEKICVRSFNPKETTWYELGTESRCVVLGSDSHMADRKIV